jgi:type I restriction-modification system DNA methylase subunit
MARKPISDMSAWPSLSLEGNLIAPAMIARIDQRDAPEQAPEDYAIRKGLTIREEISTAFRVGQSHFDAFAKLDTPSQDATRRFMAGFFKETFGFNDLTPAAAPLAMTASGRVPVVVVPPSESLDRRSPTLSVDRSRSPAFALQDHLNESEEALWGIVTNGTHLRLMRDNASLTRPAYIEADLAQIFSTEDIASFAALWLLIHRSRFGVADTPATDCPLERWREAGSREGEAARDRLADQVQIALKVLGSGFLEANPELAAKLKSGEVDLTTWFNELLRLVYRLIFLMVAEDRNLLHPAKSKAEARALYAEGYSLAGLRKQCYRAATWDKHHDRYEGIKIVFRALAHGQEALALPALGGLFAEDRLPHLETARLRNRAFMEALYRLSWLADKTGMVPVNWRAMETEELGSVYESLLELQPQLADDGKTLVFASEAAEQKGNQRKTTGSYYTPDSLVQALLDTALDPVLEKTEAEADDPAKALLKLSVIDPACGSGHFLLAAARRIATRLARIRAEGTPSLADFRHALRDVARCCIHGVDRNPMAVELTKVALWIETVDPGLPLGFFDAQIRCGDALLGVFDLQVLQDGIPDAAYKPLTGDDKETAKYYLKANRDATAGQGGFDFGTGQASMPAMKPLALDFSGFRDLPEDTVEQIGAKAKRFKELRKGQAFVRATAAANLYVAAFLLPKVGGAPAGASARTVPTTEELWMALNQGKMRQAMMDAPKVARHARAFHWPLEFPDIMQRGGFDIVIGNPPFANAIENDLSDAREFEAIKFRGFGIKGAADYSARFLGLAFDLSRPLTSVGLVLPRALLNTPTIDELRLSINQKLRPSAIFCPPERDLFAGATIDIALLTLRKTPSIKVSRSRVNDIQWKISSEWMQNWWTVVSSVWADRSIASIDGEKLGDHFLVSGSMTTADAYEIRKAIVDAEYGKGQRLVTTGLIDPQICLWGQKPCRYLKSSYAFPRLQESADLPASANRRIEQSRRPKILVAGLSPILEAYLDESGSDIGTVGTFSILDKHDKIERLQSLLDHLLTEGVLQKMKDELGGNALGGGAMTIKKEFLIALDLPNSIAGEN